jgi:hypothetical protein
MAFIPAAVVTERIREAHRNTSAPIMMLFPGYHPLIFSGGRDKIILFILFFLIIFDTSLILFLFLNVKTR